MKQLKCAFKSFLLLIIISPLKGQDFLLTPYVSLGVRFGYIFGEGFTFNAEVTVGLSIHPGLLHTSIAYGFQTMPFKPQTVTYVSVQGGLYFFGLSVGRISYKDAGTSQTGSRFAGYGIVTLPIVFPFSAGISYEALKFPSLSTQYKSIGLWGKIPIGDFRELGQRLGFGS